MQVRLEVAHSKANVKRVILRGDAVIGRSAECSLRIASSLVSRQHCKLVLRDGNVFVRDLQSSNGTFLNGAPLKPNEEVIVPPGSELSVGGVRFYVRYDGAAPLAGPGSTVDLPGIKELGVDTAKTAEWQSIEVVPPLEAGPVSTANAPQPQAESVAPAPSNPGASEPQVPALGVAVAMAVASPIDPMAAPSVVPANVPAAAPEEEVIAAAGDEIDTLMIDAEGPSEQETIDAGRFRFPELQPETFESAPAASVSDAATLEESAAPEAMVPRLPESPKDKKVGLRSLFSLFGRRKVPMPEAGGDAGPAGAADVHFDAVGEDTVSEDAPTADIAPGEAAIPFAGVVSAATPVADESAAPFLAGAAETAHAEPSADDDFGDFLKQIAQP